MMRFADVMVAAGARAGAEVVPARGQMATTLGFHIILACLGIAFPTIVLLALLTAGRLRGVRVIAALGVAAVIWGWGVAQYPVLLPGTNVTLSNAGAPQSTLDAIVVLFVAAVLIVGPSFALLFSLQGRRLLHADDDSGAAALALQPLPSAAPLVQHRSTEASPAVRIAVVAVVVDALLRGRRRSR
jgi:cytochrome bd-type quinol oxidase subunit 2